MREISNDISTMFPEKILEQLMQNIVMTRLEKVCFLQCYWI